MAGPNAGRSGRRWRTLSAQLKAQRLPCWLCGQPINYDNDGDPHAFTVDHVKPRSTHPELAEDPTNLRPAGARCNKSRGARDPKPGLGTTSRDW